MSGVLARNSPAQRRHWSGLPPEAMISPYRDHLS